MCFSLINQSVNQSINKEDIEWVSNHIWNVIKVSFDR